MFGGLFGGPQPHRRNPQQRQQDVEEGGHPTAAGVDPSERAVLRMIHDIIGTVWQEEDHSHDVVASLSDRLAQSSLPSSVSCQPQPQYCHLPPGASVSSSVPLDTTTDLYDMEWKDYEDQDSHHDGEEEEDDDDDEVLSMSSYLSEQERVEMAEAALRHFWGMSSTNNSCEDLTIVTHDDTQNNSNGPPQSMVIVNNQDDVDHDVYMLHRIESVELELQDNQQVGVLSYEDGYMTDDLLDDAELAERQQETFLDNEFALQMNQPTTNAHDNDDYQIDPVCPDILCQSEAILSSLSIQIPHHDSEAIVVSDDSSDAMTEEGLDEAELAERQQMAFQEDNFIQQWSLQQQYQDDNETQTNHSSASMLIAPPQIPILLDQYDAHGMENQTYRPSPVVDKIPPFIDAPTSEEEEQPIHDVRCVPPDPPRQLMRPMLRHILSSGSIELVNPPNFMYPRPGGSPSSSSSREAGLASSELATIMARPTLRHMESSDTFKDNEHVRSIVSIIGSALSKVRSSLTTSHPSSSQLSQEWMESQQFGDSPHSLLGKKRHTTHIIYERDLPPELQFQFKRPSISKFPFGVVLSVTAVAFAIAALTLGFLAIRHESFVTLEKPLHISTSFEDLTRIGLMNARLCIDYTSVNVDLETHQSTVVVTHPAAADEAMQNEGNGLAQLMKVYSSSLRVDSIVGPEQLAEADDKLPDSLCRQVRLGPKVVNDSIWNMARSFLSLSLYFGIFFSIFLVSSLFWETINLKPIAIGLIMTYFCQSLSFFFFDSELCRGHMCHMSVGATYNLVGSFMWFLSGLCVIRMDLRYHRRMRKLRRKMRRRHRRLIVKLKTAAANRDGCPHSFGTEATVFTESTVTSARTTSFSLSPPRARNGMLSIDNSGSSSPVNSSPTSVRFDSSFVGSDTSPLGASPLGSPVHSGEYDDGIIMPPISPRLRCRNPDPFGIESDYVGPDLYAVGLKREC
eukprot:CAMPEP_0198285978 /NCGR_PEP_ID=MMETSP1449-20131203/5181_1 /TAXON_ID=420275 /ORGANISM="Attheya septentrionalis, Strain CCMP2084" /LENGTH=963 /DNA_ID=CAMNT_0043983597 /DNA_START=444 /DNA_END=3335 /DNA_ORIENTATION=-